MQEHVLYYFSGTGNSLKAALSIQKALGNGKVVSMGTVANAEPMPVQGVSSIGLVFPCYFGGVPHRVREFITCLDLSGQEQTYVYAVVTYGVMAGTSLAETAALVGEQGATLAYAAALKAFSNYVVMYDMSSKVAEKTAETKQALTPIIADICERKTNTIKKASPLILAYNRMASKDIATQDRHFVVQETCNGCGTCVQVCPVVNIELSEGRPTWQGHCEQCLACLQWCPERAIDYGTRTRNRGRYTHPEITLRMFISYLGNDS